MSGSVIWMLSTGVDPSHMNESFQPYDRRKEALDALDQVDLVYPIRHAQVARIEFDHPLAVASKVEVVASRTASAA